MSLIFFFTEVPPETCVCGGSPLDIGKMKKKKKKRKKRKKKKRKKKKKKKKKKEEERAAPVPF